jgi:hypothetical protein
MLKKIFREIEKRLDITEEEKLRLEEQTCSEERLCDYLIDFFNCE